MPTEEELKYPIGRFIFVQPTPELRAEHIRQFRTAPNLLNEAVKNLTEDQLLSTYRPGGWTLAQVVHHLVESDVNAYPRLKYALTMDVPDVMVAEQGLWAELPDAKSPSINLSLALFVAIRNRWADAFESLDSSSFNRQWRHAWYGVLSVDALLQQYVWHARHHSAQISSHRKRMGW
ncbi:MAG: putative metal-dependent hydrolase [Ignavibacteriales bacterium]|nr:putative metal-dependent hydrolase [Ignavibacteriales bacterium]